MEITITRRKYNVHAVIDPEDPFGTFTEKWFPDLASAIQWVSEKVLPNNTKEEGK